MKSSWKFKQPFGYFFRFFLTIFILILIPLALFTIWINWALSAPSSQESTKVFEIRDGEPSTEFIKRLKDEGLIRDAFVFRLYLKFAGYDKKIQAGSFKLKTNMKAEEVAKQLLTGKSDYRITIVEGLRKEEIAEKLVERGLKIDKDKFIAKAKEGYLFPDTYLIPASADEDQILQIFKDNFEKKFSADLKAKARLRGLTDEEVIILASLVERESKGVGDESAIIAGILLKRIREGIFLGVDATIQYFLGYSTEEKTWWRQNLTQEDLERKNPYNTRINKGLPPGPICNPGLSAIRAVVEPKETNFYYYIHDKEGKVYFAQTLAEHLANINKYLK